MFILLLKKKRAGDFLLQLQEGVAPPVKLMRCSISWQWPRMFLSSCSCAVNANLVLLSTWLLQSSLLSSNIIVTNMFHTCAVHAKPSRKRSGNLTAYNTKQGCLQNEFLRRLCQQVLIKVSWEFVAQVPSFLQYPTLGRNRKTVVKVKVLPVPGSYFTFNIEVIWPPWRWRTPKSE